MSRSLNSFAGFRSERFVPSAQCLSRKKKAGRPERILCRRIRGHDEVGFLIADGAEVDSVLFGVSSGMAGGKVKVVLAVGKRKKKKKRKKRLSGVLLAVEGGWPGVTDPPLRANAHEWAQVIGAVENGTVRRRPQGSAAGPFRSIGQAEGKWPPPPAAIFNSFANWRKKPRLRPVGKTRRDGWRPGCLRVAVRDIAVEGTKPQRVFASGEMGRQRRCGHPRGERTGIPPDGPPVVSKANLSGGGSSA